MDDVYYSDPDHADSAYHDVNDKTEESYEPLKWPIQAPMVEVLKPESIHSPQTFGVFESKSCKQRSQQKSFPATQVLLIVALTIFATLSIVFMAMYFGAGKETSEPSDGQNTSRNHTEQKRKPFVYQNCSLVTNSSNSKNYSMGNGQCPVVCVRNSTRRKYTERQC